MTLATSKRSPLRPRLLAVLVGIPLLVALSSHGAAAAESSLAVYAESSALDSRLVVTDTGISVAGYATELVRALLAEADLSAEIRVVPWPRLMTLLENRPNVLGYNLTRTPEREERLHWIGEIRPVKFQLWGLRERLGELPDTLDEASDFRVSAYRNDVVEQYLLSQGFTRLIYVSENYDSLAMLQRQRIDLIPYSQSAMADRMARSASERDLLVPVIDLDAISTAHYIVMSKDSDPDLVALLQDAYRSLVASGEYQEILGDSL